MVQPDGPQMTI